MAIEGLHHVTAITGDAPANVDFYARALGLRLVKKTVNFDAPDVYHLYYGDEAGTPGSILTFFEFPDAARGRAGAGMVHRILWRVGSEESLGFWAERLEREDIEFAREDGSLRLSDPEGLDHELIVADVSDEPLVAKAPDVPAEHAIQGFHGVRAYANDPVPTSQLLQALGMTGSGNEWTAAGEKRRAELHWDTAPALPGLQGAGSVHHIAWNVADDAELEAFRGKVTSAGGRPTPIIDRQYFHSVYFRVPAGVLFELASRDIGFAYDEDPAHLGEALRLPPQHEHLRSLLEERLTPLRNPRAGAAA
jgi:glyoxalase family protein